MNTKIKELTENIRFETQLIDDHAEKRRYDTARSLLVLLKRNIVKLEKILNERSSVECSEAALGEAQRIDS